MNESMDRVLADWLHGGPESGPREALERSLAATRRVGQRPGWTLPERWIPMELTAARTRVQRPILAIVILALLTVAVVAAALIVGAQRHQPSVLVRNGAIAVGKDGDILVADRPGGDLRPLVGGRDDDGSPMFSPDGTRLVFYRGSALMVADSDGSNVVQLTPEALDASYWKFAPDGRSLVGVAVIDGARRVVVRPVDPAALLTVLDIQIRDGGMMLSQWGGPRFRPTNPEEILVVAQLTADGPRGIHVYDLATGRIRTIMEPAADQYVFEVAWLPDGEHITYRMTGPSGGPRVVAADGSGDQAFDALRGRVSPLSNDGTRILAERDDDRMAVVRINGDGKPVELACHGAETDTPECPTSWIWSPDDSMLIGIDFDDRSSSGEGPLTETYLLVDPTTGQVTRLDWVDVGTPAWQRVFP